MGIEALSRGAAHVTYVERSRKMCALIEANLALCRVPGEAAEIVPADAAEFLRRVAKRLAEPRGHKLGPWDVIFFDPPYASDYTRALKILGAHVSGFLSDSGLLIVEHHRKMDLEDGFGRLRRQRVLKQGDSCLSFYS